MEHNLAKRLRDAGFPLRKVANGSYNTTSFIVIDDIRYDYPTLAILISECGHDFKSLVRDTTRTKWVAFAFSEETIPDSRIADTPEDAVGLLWLALNEND